MIPLKFACPFLETPLLFGRANGRASRAGRVRGESLRYKDNYKARGASIFAGDSPVACMRWLGSDASTDSLANLINCCDYLLRIAGGLLPVVRIITRIVPL